MQEGPYEIAKSVLERKKINGTIIFAAIVGSHAYNCASENSDFDVLAVYAANTLDIVGLKDVQPEAAIVSSKPDVQLFEVGKFCETLQTGNPLLVQTLFIERNVYETDLWKELKKDAKHFITAQTLRAYVGYIKSEIRQQQRLEDGWEKPVYHAFRLAFEVERLINKLPPRVYFEGEERDFLMSIRQKKHKRYPLLKQLEEKMKKFEKLQPFNDIWPLNDLKPTDKNGNKNIGHEKLNAWLRRVRQVYLKPDEI